MTSASYTLANLPEPVAQLLLKSYHRENSKTVVGGLFATASAAPGHAESNIIWATSAVFDGVEHGFADPISLATAHNIKPRVDKSRDEQKRRVKEKAEVFTPSWVCNLQNNLIDEAVIGADKFNSTSGPSDKTWLPTSDPIPFTPDYTWAQYVTENRLEMTCGEGPYLFSRYDTVTGESIPVRDEQGRWHRIGLLDRKLRVVSENLYDRDEWVQGAFYALRSTFGFEWQGDNLLLARLNMLNTFVDYYKTLWSELPSEEDLATVAEIASWNLWQMDGLKMVVPESCGDECKACEGKYRGGHSGKVSLVRFGSTVKTFEDLLPDEMVGGKAPKRK